MRHIKVIDGVTVLYSYDSINRFSDWCDRDEIVEEGQAILGVYGLKPVKYTKADVKGLWVEMNSSVHIPKDVTKMVAKEVDEGFNDLRVVFWLHEWFVRSGEVDECYGKKPTRLEYALFFTIKKLLESFSMKNTKFREVVGEVRLRCIRRAYEQRQRVRSAYVKQYMRDNPEIVEKLRGGLFP